MPLPLLSAVLSSETPDLQEFLQDDLLQTATFAALITGSEALFSNNSSVDTPEAVLSKTWATVGRIGFSIGAGNVINYIFGGEQSFARYFSAFAARITSVLVFNQWFAEVPYI
jgi:hypothetical protein